MNTTTPVSIGGTKVAIAWPNMWLSGSRLRNRIGQNGFALLPVLRAPRASTGTMFASTLRWVITTPFGSAVAPDVKMISATSSRAIVHRRAACRRPSSRAREAATPGCDRRGRAIGGTSWPASTSLRIDDAGDPRQEIRGRAVVDRHDDGADEQAAPEGDDPLGPVFAEEDDLVDPWRCLKRQPCRECASRRVRPPCS